MVEGTLFFPLLPTEVVNNLYFSEKYLQQELAGEFNNSTQYFCIIES